MDNDAGPKGDPRLRRRIGWYRDRSYTELPGPEGMVYRRLRPKTKRGIKGDGIGATFCAEEREEGVEELLMVVDGAGEADEEDDMKRKQIDVREANQMDPGMDYRIHETVWRW